MKGRYGDVVGLSTHYNGNMTFNGRYSFLSINFKPNGFSKIFSVPSYEFTNQIVRSDNIFNASEKTFFEQLQSASGLKQMVALTDAWLISFLRKQKSVDFKDRITCISNSIIKNPCFVNINQLAYNANMSIRNFERVFGEEVGMAPKLFAV